MLNYDLKGLTFAVIVGYVMTGMFMTTVLLMSDWEKLSKHVRATVGADESVVYESESSSSSDEEDEENSPQDKDRPLATVIMTADWGKHSVRHKPIAEESGDDEEFKSKQNRSLPLAKKDIIGRRAANTKSIKRGPKGNSALESKSSDRQSSQETESSSDNEPHQETLEDPTAPVQIESRVHTFSDLAADSSRSRRDFDAKITDGADAAVEGDPNIAPPDGILNSFVTWWE